MDKYKHQIYRLKVNSPDIRVKASNIIFKAAKDTVITLSELNNIIKRVFTKVGIEK